MNDVARFQRHILNEKKNVSEYIQQERMLITMTS